MSRRHGQPVRATRGQARAAVVIGVLIVAACAVIQLRNGIDSPGDILAIVIAVALMVAGWLIARKDIRSE